MSTKKYALLINPNVLDQNIINNSLCPSVSLCSTAEKVLALTNVSRIGLMFDNANKCIIPFFNTKSQASAVKSTSTRPQRTNYNFYSGGLVDLLTTINTGKTTPIILDLISCNMNSDKFLTETKLISALTGVKIEYSVNQTGTQANADWILESNNENLIGIYFTNNILTWKHTLAAGNDIVYSTPNDICAFFNANSPKALKYNAHTHKYTLHQNVLLDNYTNVGEIYIQLNNKEHFDGKNHIIEVTNPSYGLFVFNSKSMETTIENVVMGSISGDYSNIIISSGGGGLVRKLQSFFTLKNCVNYRSANDNMTGGLCGSLCSKFKITQCTNYGYRNLGSGGICGPFCASFEISKCKNLFLSGDDVLGADFNLLTSDSGGICGLLCANFKLNHCQNTIDFSNDEDSGMGGIVGLGCFNFTVENSINSGNFLANNDYWGGGICGFGCNQFKIKKCTNTGNMSGAFAGGITACNCSNYELYMCTNYGDIGDYSGGIAGENNGSPQQFVYFHTLSQCVEINKCVNYGKINGDDSGGIVGPRFGLIAGQIPIINNKLSINNCVNNGAVTSKTGAGGIAGAQLGKVDLTNGVYATIRIIDCKTVSGNIIGSDALMNNTDVADFGKDNNDVYTKLYIANTYTKNKAPLISSFANNINSVTATYTKLNGEHVNLIAHPTYTSHH
jgi:hypothetical protein